MYIQTNKLFFASLSLCCKHHYPINAFSRVLVKRIILTRLLKPQDVSPNYSGIKKEKFLSPGKLFAPIAGIKIALTKEM